MVFLILNGKTYEAIFSPKTDTETSHNKELIFNTSHSSKRLKNNNFELIFSESYNKKLLGDIILIDQNYRDNIQLSEKINDCKLKLSSIKNEFKMFNLDSSEDKIDFRNYINEFRPNIYNYFQIYGILNLINNINSNLELKFALNKEFLNSSNLNDNKKISNNLVHKRIKSIKKKFSELLK